MATSQAEVGDALPHGTESLRSYVCSRLVADSGLDAWGTLRECADNEHADFAEEAAAALDARAGERAADPHLSLAATTWPPDGTLPGEACLTLGPWQI